MTSEVESTRAQTRPAADLNRFFELDSSDEEFVYDKNLDDIVITEVDRQEDGEKPGESRPSSSIGGAAVAEKPEQLEKRRRDREYIRNGKMPDTGAAPVAATVPAFGRLGSTNDKSSNVSMAASPSSTMFKSNLKDSSDHSSSTAHLAGITEQMHLTNDRKNKAESSLPNSPKKHRAQTFSRPVVVDLTLSDDDDEMADAVEASPSVTDGAIGAASGAANVAANGAANGAHGPQDDLNNNVVRPAVPYASFAPQVPHAAPAEVAQPAAFPSAPPPALPLPRPQPETFDGHEVIVLSDLSSDDELEAQDTTLVSNGDGVRIISSLSNDSHGGSSAAPTPVRETGTAARSSMLLSLQNALESAISVRNYVDHKLQAARRGFEDGRVFWERALRNYEQTHDRPAFEAARRDWDAVRQQLGAFEKRSRDANQHVVSLRHQYRWTLESASGYQFQVDPQQQQQQQQQQQHLGYASNIYTDDSSSLRKLLNNIKPDETYVEGQANTPEALTVNLLTHQRIGLSWLSEMEKSSNRGGILADDMGLGKTIQLLSLMVSRQSEDPECRINLIVAPIALLKQWQSEISTKIKEQFALKTFIYHQHEKVNHFVDFKRFDVVLVSYNTLASEYKKHFGDALRDASVAKNSSLLPARHSGGARYCSPFYAREAKFFRVVLDEAQWIKNKLTQMSKCVALLDAEYRWCLSGTPMQNSIDELYSLIRFLRIKPYSAELKFRSDIVLPIRNASSNYYDARDTSQAMKKLQALLKAILLRRTKDAVVDGKPILELPAKVTEVSDVEMCTEERTFYANLEASSAQKADALMNGEARNANYYSSILSLLLRLRQACCHKYLVEIGVRKKDGAREVRPALVRELAPDVVHSIRQNHARGFVCPICFDSIDDAKIVLFTACGHAVCDDCVENFFESDQVGSSENGPATAPCRTCATNVRQNHAFSYEAFDLVHNRQLSDREVDDRLNVNYGSAKKVDRRRAVLKLVQEDGGTFKSSAKIDLCIEKIEQVLSANGDEKIIVFSQFTLLFELIKLVLDQKKILYQQYDGSMNADRRNDTISEFYRNPLQRVLLLSLKAGNVGLTLTCANHVILMDPFWNPYVEEQAADRAHRIGQNREVHIHRLLIQNTVEDRILKLQEQKRELINGALDSKGAASISRLGRNEIRFLFGLGDL